MNLMKSFVLIQPLLLPFFYGKIMHNNFPSVIALSDLTFKCQTCCFLIMHIICTLTHLCEAISDKGPFMIQALSEVIILYPSFTQKEQIF